MKKHFRELLGFTSIFASTFLFLGSFAVAGDKAASPIQKLFETKCAQCHGKDGKGVAKMAKVLKVDVKTLDLSRAESVNMKTEEMIKIVTDGKKKMPKYKGKLKDGQIKEVVEYLRTLQFAKAAK